MDNYRSKTKAELIAEIERLEKVANSVTDKNDCEILEVITKNYPNTYISIIEKDLTIGFTSGQEFEKHGLDPNTFIGLSLDQVFAEHASIVKKHYLETFKGEQQRFELFLNEQNQLFKTLPLTDGSGKIDRILAIVEIITEQRQAEKNLKQSEAFNRSIVDNSFDCIKILDLEANLQFMSKGGQNLLEINNVKDYIGKSWLDLFTDKYRKSAIAAVNRAKSGEIGRFKSCIPTEKGKPMWWDAIVTSVTDEKGNLVSLLAISRDITEQKKSEEELKKQRDLFELVINSVPAKIFWKDLNSVYLGCNTNFAKDAGMETIESVIGKDDDLMVWKEDADVYREDDQQVLKSGEPKTNYEEEFINKDGEKVVWKTSKLPLKNNEGDIFGVIAISENITQRISIEKSLRETLIFNETLLNTSPDIIYIYDLVEHRNIYINDGISKILGYSVEEVQDIGNELISSLMHKDDFKIYLSKTIPRYQTAKDEELIEHEYRMKHKNGDWYWLHSKELIFKRNPDNSPKQIFGIISDITNSKETQKRILNERNKAQQYLEIAEVILLSIDSNGIVQLINPKGCEVVGYSEEDIVGKNWYDNFLPERMRKSVKEVARKIFSGEIGSVRYYENSILTKSGEEKIIAWHNAILTDEEGNIIGTLSSGEDITERKLSEEKIKVSEKQYRLISEKITDIIWLMDLNGNSTYVSPSIEKFSGFTVDEYLNQTIQTRFEESSANYALKTFHEEISKYLNSSNQLKDYYKKIELEYNCKEGQTKWGELIITPYFNEDDQLIGIHGVTRDVTDRKEAEEDLNESLQREKIQANVVRNSPLAIAYGYLDGRLDYCNKAFCELTGYSEEELIRINWSKVLTPLKWNDIEAKELQKLSFDNNIVQYEKEYIHKSGKIIPIELVVSAKFNEDKNIVHFVGFIYDITERKIAEEELKKYQENLEVLVKERTIDLEVKNKELERFNDLFVDRELRIKELREKVEKLENDSLNLL